MQPEDRFLLPDSSPEVADELQRRMKNMEDRQNREMQKRDNQEEMNAEEKWKGLHMQMATASHGLRP